MLMGNVTPATLTILVVDDDAMITEFMAFYLETKGYRVLTAKHGCQALALAAGQQPDIIISDILMPVMDGIALLAALQDNPQLSHIPVILMSAIGQGNAWIPPATAFLAKPFSLKDIDQVLARLSEAAPVRTTLADDSPPDEALP